MCDFISFLAFWDKNTGNFEVIGGNGFDSHGELYNLDEVVRQNYYEVERKIGKKEDFYNWDDLCVRMDDYSSVHQEEKVANNIKALGRPIDVFLRLVKDAVKREDYSILSTAWFYRLFLRKSNRVATFYNLYEFAFSQIMCLTYEYLKSAETKEQITTYAEHHKTMMHILMPMKTCLSNLSTQYWGDNTFNDAISWDIANIFAELGGIVIQEDMFFSCYNRQSLFKSAYQEILVGFQENPGKRILNYIIDIIEEDRKWGTEKCPTS